MNIEQVYEQILSLTDLNPSPKVNDLFTRLVNIATDYDDTKFKLTQSQRLKLQEICSIAEYNLERFWASKIVNSTNPSQELQNFPYLKNYRDLTRLEWFSVQGCNVHPKHSVLFVGSGPLPMTAIILALDYNIKTTVIDIDKEAVDLSRKLLKKLGLAEKIEVKQADATEFAEYRKYNIIFIAALAGTNNKSKRLIFQKIKETAVKDLHLVARSSWGNRKLLYRPLKKDIFKFFNPVIQIDPYNEIVNSIVILNNYDQ